MRCHNCGKNVPYMGRECPYCHADKTGDKLGTALAIIGSIIGLCVGVSVYGEPWPVIGCTIAGMMPGAVISAVMNR